MLEFGVLPKNTTVSPARVGLLALGTSALTTRPPRPPSQANIITTKVHTAITAHNKTDPGRHSARIHRMKHFGFPHPSATPKLF